MLQHLYLLAGNGFVKFQTSLSVGLLCSGLLRNGALMLSTGRTLCMPNSVLPWNASSEPLSVGKHNFLEDSCCIGLNQKVLDASESSMELP